MEYNIAEASTREKLVDRVNFFIQKGWNPIGGVMYDFEETVVSSTGQERPKFHGRRDGPKDTHETHRAVRNSMYCQAMIKE